MHSRCVAALSAAGLAVLCLAGCGDKEKAKDKETPPAPAPPTETRTAPVRPPEAPATAPSPKATTAPARAPTLADISSGEYLLVRQHAVWANARRSLRSDRPNLNLLRSIDLYLGGRTARRLAKEGDRPKKDEILARLKALNETYRAEILSKVALDKPQVKLKPRVTLKDLRRAFDKIDADYKAFQAMTQPGRKTPPASP